jgi:hypothetical protein
MGTEGELELAIAPFLAGARAHPLRPPARQVRSWLLAPAAACCPPARSLTALSTEEKGVRSVRQISADGADPHLKRIFISGFNPTHLGFNPNSCRDGSNPT